MRFFLLFFFTVTAVIVDETKQKDKYLKDAEIFFRAENDRIIITGLLLQAISCSDFQNVGRAPLVDCEGTAKLHKKELISKPVCNDYTALSY